MGRLLIIILTIFFVTACQANDIDDTEENPAVPDIPDKTMPGQNEGRPEGADSNETTESAENGEATDEQQNDAQYMESQMQELNFSEIEVEVEYDNDEEFEVEIEADDHRSYTAEVEDELNNTYLFGREAFDFIYEKVQDLDVASDSDQNEV